MVGGLSKMGKRQVKLTLMQKPEPHLEPIP